MGETEKIKFKGFSAYTGNKIERTISGVFDRVSEEMEIKLSMFDQLRYDMIVLSEKPEDGRAYKFVKLKVKQIVQDKIIEEHILLNGIAYVMNSDGTTVDTIKSGR